MRRTEHYDEYLQTPEKINLGGHKCIIKSASIQTSSNNKEMLVIQLDTDLEDSQPQFFMEQYTKDTRIPKKWPNNAISRFTEGSPFLARFCAAVEESNPGFKCWSSDDANGLLKVNELIDKKVGAVFGEIEDEYNGRLFTKHEIRYFCNVENALSKEVPKKKELIKATPDPLNDINWQELADDVDGLPFN